MRSQIYIRGPASGFFCTQSECFTTSNCIFNFNFLAVVVADILGGPKFTLKGGPALPSGKIFVAKAGTLPYLGPNGVYKDNFLAVVVSEILGLPKFTLGGLAPPGRPLAEFVLYPKRVFHHI